MRRSRLVPLAVIPLLAVSAVGGRAGNLPSSVLSTVPGLVRLAGATSGVPDASAAQFKVEPRDLANNPVARASIVIDLSHCTDLVFCSDQLDADALVNCAAKTVRKFTNALGEVTFTLLGSSTGTGNASSLASSATVYANGVRIGSPSAASFDLDGLGGVGAGDLSAWLVDFGSGMGWARSDFDGNGSISAADLSLWLEVFGAGGSAESCRASCP